MLGFVKITMISALLSFGAVTFIERVQPAASEGKLYVERLPSTPADILATGATAAARPGAPMPVIERAAKGDKFVAAPGACAQQTWPFYDAGCLGRDDSRAGASVRMITIETREGNTSTLQRVAQATVAQR